MKHNIFNLFSLVIVLMTYGLLAQAEENSSAGYKQSLEHAAALVCGNKIQEEFKMSKEDFSLYLILTSNDRKDQSGTQHAWVGSCGPQAKDLWDKCMRDKLSRPGDQSQSALDCYRIVSNQIKIDRKEYQQKIANADQISKQFAAAYQKCLPPQIGKMGPKQQRASEERCLEASTQTLMPVVQQMRADKLCTTPLECVQVLKKRSHGM